MTAQVATRGADKDGGDSGQEPLSLNRVEDFRNPQEISFLELVLVEWVGW